MPCGSGLMPRAHQIFRSVLAVKLLGIMLRIRWWPTIFFIITAGDADGWCWNCPVWSAPQTSLQIYSINKFFLVLTKDYADLSLKYFKSVKITSKYFVFFFIFFMDEITKKSPQNCGKWMEYPIEVVHVHIWMKFCIIIHLRLHQSAILSLEFFLK